jgi:hypothetical protein
MSIGKIIWCTQPVFGKIYCLILLSNKINLQINMNIIVFEDFELKNGLLGLDRDVYLSVVKFLVVPALREV